MDLMRTVHADAGVADGGSAPVGRLSPRQVRRASGPRSDKGDGDPNQDPDPPMLRIG